MDTKCRIKLSNNEVERIQSIQREIASKTKELNDYVSELKKAYNIEETKLCVLTYKKAIEVDKERRFLEPPKYIMKEFSRLAFVSWIPYTNKEGFKIKFNSVSNNKIGNEINLYDLEDISYDILNDYTVEEAKKMLKKFKAQD